MGNVVLQNQRGKNLKAAEGKQGARQSPCIRSSSAASNVRTEGNVLQREKVRATRVIIMQTQRLYRRKYQPERAWQPLYPYTALQPKTNKKTARGALLRFVYFDEVES